MMTTFPPIKQAVPGPVLWPWEQNHAVITWPHVFIKLSWPLKQGGCIQTAFWMVIGPG